MELYLIARRTSDMEKALAFYSGVLGFEKSHEVRMKGRHVVYLGPSSREWAFQLVSDGGAPPLVDPGEFVGLETGELEAELARLRERNAAIDGPHVLPGGA